MKRAILTSDIVQHAQPKQWIGKTENSTSDDGGPVRCISITRECEPQERDREEPNGDQGGEEASFRSVDAVLLAVSGIKPCLYRDEAEHDQDSNNEVEVGEICIDSAGYC